MRNHQIASASDLSERLAFFAEATPTPLPPPSKKHCNRSFGFALIPRQVWILGLALFTLLIGPFPEARAQDEEQLRKIVSTLMKVIPEHRREAAQIAFLLAENGELASVEVLSGNPAVARIEGSGENVRAIPIPGDVKMVYGGFAKKIHVPFGQYKIRVLPDSEFDPTSSGLIPEVRIHRQAGSKEPWRPLTMGTLTLNRSAAADSIEGAVRSLFRADHFLATTLTTPVPRYNRSILTAPQQEVLYSMKPDREGLFVKFRRHLDGVGSAPGPFKGLIHLPTGIGKTVVAFEAAEKLHASAGLKKPILLFFVQNTQILEDVWTKLKTRGVPLELIARLFGDSAGETRDIERKSIILTTRTTGLKEIETITKAARSHGRPVIAFFDEAHHTGKQGGEWQKIRSEMERAFPGSENVFLDLTATPWHREQPDLIAGYDGNYFTSFATDEAFQQLRAGVHVEQHSRRAVFEAMTQGYLSPFGEFHFLLERTGTDGNTISLKNTMEQERSEQLIPQIRKLEAELKSQNQDQKSSDDDISLEFAEEDLPDEDATVPSLSAEDLKKRIREIHLPLVGLIREDIIKQRQRDSNRQIVEYDRGIIYVETILHAMIYEVLLNEIFKGDGSISFRSLHSGMKRSDRQAVVDWLNDADKDRDKYKHKFVLAIDILNEGVDIPSVNRLIYARKVNAMKDLLQTLGRALRLAIGKSALRVTALHESIAAIFADIPITKLSQLFLQSQKGQQDQNSSSQHGPVTVLLNGSPIPLEESIRRIVIPAREAMTKFEEAAQKVPVINRTEKGKIKLVPNGYESQKIFSELASSLIWNPKDFVGWLKTNQIHFDDAFFNFGHKIYSAAHDLTTPKQNLQKEFQNILNRTDRIRNPAFHDFLNGAGVKEEEARALRNWSFGGGVAEDAFEFALLSETSRQKIIHHLSQVQGNQKLLPVLRQLHALQKQDPRRLLGLLFALQVWVEGFKEISLVKKPKAPLFEDHLPYPPEWEEWLLEGMVTVLYPEAQTPQAFEFALKKDFAKSPIFDAIHNFPFSTKRDINFPASFSGLALGTRGERSRTVAIAAQLEESNSGLLSAGSIVNILGAEPRLVGLLLSVFSKDRDSKKRYPLPPLRALVFSKMLHRQSSNKKSAPEPSRPPNSFREALLNSSWELPEKGSDKLRQEDVKLLIQMSETVLKAHQDLFVSQEEQIRRVAQDTAGEKYRQSVIRSNLSDVKKRQILRNEISYETLVRKEQPDFKRNYMQSLLDQLRTAGYPVDTVRFLWAALNSPNAVDGLREHLQSDSRLAKELFLPLLKVFSELELMPDDLETLTQARTGNSKKVEQIRNLLNEIPRIPPNPTYLRVHRLFERPAREALAAGIGQRFGFVVYGALSLGKTADRPLTWLEASPFLVYRLIQEARRGTVLRPSPIFSQPDYWDLTQEDLAKGIFAPLTQLFQNTMAGTEVPDVLFTQKFDVLSYLLIQDHLLNVANSGGFGSVCDDVLTD